MHASGSGGSGAGGVPGSSVSALPGGAGAPKSASTQLIERVLQSYARLTREPNTLSYMSSGYLYDALTMRACEHTVSPQYETRHVHHLHSVNPLVDAARPDTLYFVCCQCAMVVVFEVRRWPRNTSTGDTLRERCKECAAHGGHFFSNHSDDVQSNTILMPISMECGHCGLLADMHVRHPFLCLGQSTRALSEAHQAMRRLVDVAFASATDDSTREAVLSVIEMVLKMMRNALPEAQQKPINRKRLIELMDSRAPHYALLDELRGQALSLSQFALRLLLLAGFSETDESVVLVKTRPSWQRQLTTAIAVLQHLRSKRSGDMLPRGARTDVEVAVEEESDIHDLMAIDGNRFIHMFDSPISPDTVVSPFANIGCSHRDTDACIEFASRHLLMGTERAQLHSNILSAVRTIRRLRTDSLALENLEQYVQTQGDNVQHVVSSFKFFGLAMGENEDMIRHAAARYLDSERTASGPSPASSPSPSKAEKRDVPAQVARHLRAIYNYNPEAYRTLGDYASLLENSPRTIEEDARYMTSSCRAARPRDMRAGLKNNVFVCFFNAMLQLYFGVRPLRRALLQIAQGGADDASSFIRSLQLILGLMQDGWHEYLNAEPVLGRLLNLVQQGVVGQQQDATDLHRWLLRSVREHALQHAGLRSMVFGSQVHLDSSSDAEHGKVDEFMSDWHVMVTPAHRCLEDALADTCALTPSVRVVFRDVPTVLFIVLERNDVGARGGTTFAIPSALSMTRFIERHVEAVYITDARVAQINTEIAEVERRLGELRGAGGRPSAEAVVSHCIAGQYSFEDLLGDTARELNNALTIALDVLGSTISGLEARKAELEAQRVAVLSALPQAAFHLAGAVMYDSGGGSMGHYFSYQCDNGTWLRCNDERVEPRADAVEMIQLASTSQPYVRALVYVSDTLQNDRELCQLPDSLLDVVTRCNAQLRGGDRV